MPYKGNVSAQQDVIAGRVSMMFDFLATTQQFVATNRLKMIATTGPARSSFARNTPTLEESGVKDFDITAWFGLFVKAGTPRPIVDQLNAALQSTLALPEIRSALTAQGYDVTAGSSQELEMKIKKAQQLWAPVFRQANIQPE